MIGDYLRDRLAEVGADRVFGVPGDYTLTLLDYLTGQPDMTWTGCTNRSEERRVGKECLE